MSPRRLAPWSSVLVVAAVLAGCPDRRAPSPDASTPDPTDAAITVDAADAGEAAPGEGVGLAITYLPLDGGTPLEIDFSGGERPLIEPTQELEVTTLVPLRNYRVRMFDEVDRAMVSDDEALERDGGVWYRIHLPAPLKTGHRYTLAVDAQTGAELTDAAGRTHPDVRLEFQVAGEKEKPAPPKPVRKKRRPR